MKTLNVTDFLEKNFAIHGEFNGEVYRTKRNGVIEKYPYAPVSPYKRTTLTIRNEWIRKFAITVSNPRNQDYKSIIRKLNYYTPYILNEGKQKFLAETVFYVRDRGEYEFLWQGNEMGTVYTLSKRTELILSFHSEGDKLLEVYYNEQIYCQRRFIITNEEDLDAKYEDWLSAHFTEILLMPEPEYESLPTYRRGMQSQRNWILALEGKIYEEVHYTRNELKYKDGYRQNPWVYHRKTYNHSTNPQTSYFCNIMKDIGAAWQALSEEEKEYWNNEANKLVRKRVIGFNVFTAFIVTRDL
ncbi:MAG: HMG-box domain-containing protein [Candidatus Cloacimonetes bacterium]|nr:HMG-box domain-containing protein [Candidatus Cloacimonadota bacterium]